jgi:hypothetical protein
MKKAACVKLLAVATIIALSGGGKSEARSTSHEHHGSDHHAQARASTHESRGSAHESRGSVHEARGHESRSSSREARNHEGRNHEGRGFFRESGRGHSQLAGWQRYGRGQHLALSGRSGRQGGYSYGGGIQCVTFARDDTGIELSGNARDWWGNAAGVYQRGSRPEPGSVLNFRANGHMPMGHVSVVDRVVDGRTVVVDHANWGGPGAVRGGISRDISVVDVSPNNDWSAVRVALGHSGDFGSIYPTYGFIYNRPDAGTILASTDTNTNVPAMNPPPRDLRPHVRDVSAFDEVAEAPDSAMPSFGHHLVHHSRHHSLSVVSHHVSTKHHR